jgi:hypothetical protein
MLPTIVFVHLNSPLPLYLKFNIVSTIKKFPNAKVVLIRNDKKTTGIHPKLFHFDYQSGHTSLSIENSLGHPKDFRNNFWFSAIQRFDALRAYIYATREPIMHIESDVIVSRDFPLEKFAMSKMKIAYPVVANNRGVASTVFVRDLKTAETLVEFADEMCTLNSRTTDMEILASFFENYLGIANLLTFGPNSKNAYHENSSMRKDPISSEMFNGVFDGNDIGVFLFGTDPRNARGISYLRNSIQGNYARINNWKFEFDRERRFINLEFEGEIKPIFSVHATSKRLALFHHLTQEFVIRRYINKHFHVGSKALFPLVTLAMIGRKMLKIWKN